MPRIKKHSAPAPTIKGLFVNSHVNCLREERGETAVEELARRFGGRVVFRAAEDVPVRDEVRIIELCLEVLDPEAARAPDARHAAGRLHFRNFSETRLGQVLLTSLPHTKAGFKTLVLNSGSIGRSIFKHTNFTTTERDKSVTIVMENTDYPIEHFAGFFAAWAALYGFDDTDIAYKTEGATHTYTIGGF